MKSLILFLALVCGGVSFLVYTDNQFVSGNWAGQICRSAGALCHNPQLLAFAAAGLLALCNPAPRAINPNSTSALSSRTGTPRSSRTGTATPMVTRSASDLYGIRMTSEISNLGRVSEFSSYRTLSERLGRTSILDSSDTLAPSINKFDPRLFKILQNPDLFENAAAKAATPAAPASSMATELASLGAAKDVAKEMASPSADIGSDPLFHFSVLSGKLEMGLVATTSTLVSRVVKSTSIDGERPAPSTVKAESA